MSSEPTTTPQPERAAGDFSRRIRLPFAQSIGMSVVLLVPVLAVIGLLGDGEATRAANVDGATLQVRSPTSARHGNAKRLEIKIAGGPTHAGQRVTLTIARDYLARFNEITTRPEITRWTAEGAVIENTLSADEPLEIVVELKPEKHGWARGAVRAEFAFGAALETDLGTLVFP